LARGLAVEPAQHELAAHGAQRFHLRAEGLVGGDHLLAHLALATPQIRVVELARKRELDVGLREQADLFAGVSEAQALLPLQLEDVLDILRPQPAGMDQDGAEPALGGLECNGLGRHGNRLARARYGVRFHGLEQAIADVEHVTGLDQVIEPGAGGLKLVARAAPAGVIPPARASISETRTLEVSSGKRPARLTSPRTETWLLRICNDRMLTCGCLMKLPSASALAMVCSASGIVMPPILTLPISGYVMMPFSPTRVSSVRFGLSNTEMRMLSPGPSRYSGSLSCARAPTASVAARTSSAAPSRLRSLIE